MKSYQECASSYELWIEYIDPFGTWTEEQFNAMDEDERVGVIVATFGPEVTQ